MQRTIHNNVACYNLSAGKTFPEWLKEPEEKRKKNPNYSRRIELLQDFEMPTMSTNVWQSKNGTHIFLTGGYPPQFKCFDVNQLSVKFSRHTQHHIVQGLSLSEDYRQLALLLEGRWVELHGQGGVHHTLRAPIQGRHMIYNEFTCDLVIGGSSDDIHRLNLASGEFQEPYQSEGDVNCLVTFPTHNIDAAACDDGVVRCFTYNTKGVIGQTTIPRGAATSIAVDPFNAYNFAVGSDGGVVYVFDVRMARPLLAKDHCTSLPIKKVSYFEGDNHTHQHQPFILSADSNSLRIWDKNDGGNFTSIESKNSINDFLVVKSGHNMVPPYNASMSGLVLFACEDQKGGIMFIPKLGIAPKWSSFLDTLTEELDHSQHITVYQDYTFLSREELNSLGLDDAALLAAKDVVRPVMHGYFVEEKFLASLRTLLNVEDNQGEPETARQRKKREEDLITPTLPRRRKKTGEVDERFARHLQENKKLTELDPRSTSYASKRDALHSSMFESEGKGVAKLKGEKDFLQSDSNLLRSHREEKKKASHSLGHRARAMEDLRAEMDNIETDGMGNISTTFSKSRSKKPKKDRGSQPLIDEEEITPPQEVEKPKRRKFFLK